MASLRESIEKDSSSETAQRRRRLRPSRSISNYSVILEPSMESRVMRAVETGRGGITNQDLIDSYEAIYSFIG